jgi:nitrous oxide reductase
MAVSTRRVTVTTTAVALNTASTSGLCLRIKNGAAIVALGPSTVTAANGYEVAVAAEVTVELDPGDVLFAVSGSTSDVQVLQS